MAPVTPTGEPLVLTAGDSWRWRIPDHGDYPNSEGWSLEYDLVGKSILLTASISEVFQTSGDDANHWLVTAAAADTGLNAGRYQLFKRFVGSGDFSGRVETLGSDGKLGGPPFVISIKADPSGATAGDFQTDAEKQLALVRTVISARLTNDTAKEYLVAGRRFVKEDLDTLYKIEARLIAATQTERSGSFGREVLVEFDRVGV